MWGTLFVTTDWQEESINVADRLVIGKAMFDIGMPLSNTELLTGPFPRKDHTLFVRALETLLKCERVYSNESEDDSERADNDSFIVNYNWEEISKWNTLKERCNTIAGEFIDVMISEEEQVLSTIRKMDCSYYDVIVKSSITDTHLNIKIEGYQGIFSEFLINLIKFTSSFSDMTIKWESKLNQIQKLQEAQIHANRNSDIDYKHGSDNREDGDHTSTKWNASDYREVG
ncbi:hypothetical protein ACFYU8_17860 [Brevibacillus sp. NPDC003359]|uniref:hypothetical protein n=1 Tax=unclassified Brevibacillus TaxID=2684853 RepID=UPI0036754B8E